MLCRSGQETKIPTWKKVKKYLNVFDKIRKQPLISILGIILCSTFSIDWELPFPLFKIQCSSFVLPGLPSIGLFLLYTSWISSRLSTPHISSRSCQAIRQNGKATNTPAFVPLPHAPHPFSSAFLHSDLVLFSLNRVQPLQPSEKAQHGQKAVMLIKIRKKEHDIKRNHSIEI